MLKNPAQQAAPARKATSINAELDKVVPPNATVPLDDVQRISVSSKRYPAVEDLTITKKNAEGGVISSLKIQIAQGTKATIEDAEGDTVGLAHAVKGCFPQLFAAALGAAKVQWLDTLQYDPQSPPAPFVPLAGWGTLLAENPAASLTVPAAFITGLELAATHLLQQNTGNEINKSLLKRIEIYFAPGQLRFSLAAADGQAVLHADPAELTGQYVAIVPGNDGSYPLSVQANHAAAILGHELIHAIHAFQDYPGYIQRGATDAAHPDWEDHEEQLTISGYVDQGTRSPVCECSLLQELGLPLRWGHKSAVSAGTQNVTAEQMQQFYGPPAV